MRVLIFWNLYPGQKKILSSEVTRFDLRKIRETTLRISSPPTTFFLYLDRYFELILIVFNSEFHQKIWEREFFPETPEFIKRLLRDTKPITKIDFYAEESFYRILAKQILFFRPDVVINPIANLVNSKIFRVLKSEVRFKLIGYHGATPAKIDFSPYDLFLSSFMPMVTRARAHGVRAELIPYGIDPTEIKNILRNITQGEKKYPVVFSGSLHMVHRSRKILLERIAEEFGDQFHLFTHSESSLTPTLRSSYRGSVFGEDHIKIFALSKISINHHGDILPWAHNIRLYEATAAGSLLITDDLPGLRSLFEVGKEVVTYSSPEECIKMIRKYLKDEEEREKIAEAGQRKTLSHHTYESKLESLARMIENITG